MGQSSMRVSNRSKTSLPSASPFGETRAGRPTISLWMLTFSLVVFAGISALIMFAARVPLVANNINDLFGLPHTAVPDKPDRTTHLIFLLFCYSSPLLFAMWVGLIHSLYSRISNRRSSDELEDEPDSPFA